MAALSIVAWIAIGSCVRSVRAGNSFVDLSVAILIGSAATSLGYTIAAMIGMARSGALIVALTAIGITLIRTSELRVIARQMAGEWRSIAPVGMLDRSLFAGLCAVLSVCATAQPREADVVRYHLAHIRQIASEGRWQWMPDVHDALPFAWSLNYLPFELVRVPQGAAFLNAMLALVFVAVVAQAGSGKLAKGTGALICIAFVSQPYAMKIFSAAFPDSYAILITALLGVMLMRMSSIGERDAALFGFIAWIGIASRYQMVAMSIAVSAVALWTFLREAKFKDFTLFSGGALCAVIVSSPFYINNWLNSGNPFWPLPTRFFATDVTYVQRLGSGFAHQYTSPGETLLAAVTRLLTSAYIAPLPIVLILLSVTTIFVRDKNARRVGILACIFLGMWAVMSPRLYPTHILPLVGLGPLMAMAFFPKAEAGQRLTRSLVVGLRSGAAAFITLSAVFAWDYAKYDFTGNTRDFHRFTWYYPVYEWANHNTPRDSKFLVVVYSGISYYLDRPYRRADPWLSAEVDWSRVGSPSALDSIMGQRGFDYLIYDDRYWNQYPGGKLMTGVIHSAIARKVLVPVHSSREKLYSGRVTREFTETNVYVLKRANAPTAEKLVP